MSLFRVNRQTTAKFFYPYETLGNEEIGGIALSEEVADTLNDGLSTKKVQDIMNRFSVEDWDWDDDDYIMVTFESGVNDDTIQAEIDCINSQLGYIWNQAIDEARENLREHECECCEETDEFGHCRGRNSEGKCQGGFVPQDNDISEEFRAGQAYARGAVEPSFFKDTKQGKVISTPPPNIWDANEPPKKDEWDANIPEVSGDWNTWNR